MRDWKCETGNCRTDPAFSPRRFWFAFSIVLHFPAPHLPDLHIPTLEMWSLIFRSCRSVFDLFGPSVVLRFPVLHFQSILFIQSPRTTSLLQVNDVWVTKYFFHSNSLLYVLFSYFFRGENTGRRNNESISATDSRSARIGKLSEIQ